MQLVRGLVLCTLVTSASANPASTTPGQPAAHTADDSLDVQSAMSEIGGSIGFAVNAPVRWFADETAFAGSAYLGAATHHAIRINYASYAYGGREAAGTLIGDLFFDGDGSDATLNGRVRDFGVGYQVYPRTLFSGFVAEAGFLRRTYDTYEDDPNMSPNSVRTDATMLGGRVLVGWSWLYADRVFAAMSVGMSMGRTSGTETTAPIDYPRESTTSTITRMEIAAEGYIRFGIKL